MSHARIPATVAILTRNSAGSLPCALESVKRFAEILVCDGGSTDNTLEVARSYGARIIGQDQRFLNEVGRITNFAGVRNQMLEVATQDWFFFLDSDEYADSGLVEAIERASQGTPKAFWVSRRYVWEGKEIECSTGYPNQQVRFFHKSVVRSFVKEVHERVEIKPGGETESLPGVLYVPVSANLKAARQKWFYYLSLERRRRGPISFRLWARLSLRESLIGALYLFRLLKIIFLCRGSRMPIRIELMRPWYQYRYVVTLLRNVRRF